MEIKEWFTAQELAGLPGMPSTYSAVIRWAKKNLTLSRRKLLGKGLEYAVKCLPAETQAHLQAQAIAAIIQTERSALQSLTPPARRAALEAEAAAKAAALPAPTDALKTSVAAAIGTSLRVTSVAGGVQADGSCLKGGQLRRVKAELCDKDRAYQDAALQLCVAVDDLILSADCSARQACSQLAQFLLDGQATPALQLAAVATYLKPRANTKLGGFDNPRGRLQRMHGFYIEGLKQGDCARYLVAGRPEKKGPKPEHLRAFLKCYCTPNRPTITQAWKNSTDWYASQGIARPAVDTWVRIENALPVIVKNRGRMTGSAFRSLFPSISRDVSMFKSNDIWVGDGHSFKARIQSPIHGNAFVPEVTLILDWRSRKVVGWSVALSENVTAVSDAFRHAQLQTRARPLVYYRDNGSGQTGKHIDHDVVGTLVRQGICSETGIPGNPQGRGVIERLWASTLLPLAETYPTYHGKKGDKETQRKVGIELAKAQRKGEDSRLLPPFLTFISDLRKALDDYNALHSHSGLDGMTPNEAYAAYMDPNSTMVSIGDAVINSLWMPEEIRVPSRCVIQLFNNEYFCAGLDLKIAEGEKVRVRFDIHNANTVQVWSMAGYPLCLGVWDGNRRAAFPVAFIEREREKRALGIKRRAYAEIDRADAELMVTLDASGNQVLPFGQVTGRQGDALTVPFRDRVNPPELTQEASAPESPKEETPDEARMRWYAEQAEQDERDRLENAQNDGPDRLFLMMRAEQEELERQEQEEERRVVLMASQRENQERLAQEERDAGRKAS